MCGIVGYFGKGTNISMQVNGDHISEGNTIDVLLEGLRRLEYRGYDSSGLALHDGNEIKIIKSEGKVSNLEDKVKEKQLDNIYHMGMAHTRWATHGIPNETNAHPHSSMDGKIAVVHNGIIENYKALKNSLIEQGVRFRSDTDSEVIAQLIEYFYKTTNSFELAVQTTLTKLEGSYAILAMHEDSGKLIGARKGSPLCMGINGDDIIFGSDALPFVDQTKKVMHLRDEEMVVVSKYGYSIRNFDGLNIKRELSEVPFDIEAIGKEGKEHFMLKEILEQPYTFQNACFSRISHIDSLRYENFKNLPQNINRILFIACGTSLYAGMIGSYIMEKYVGIPSFAESASEFRYRDPVIFPNDIVIAISQSGQTADTKEAFKLAIENECYCAGIVNVVGSEIARLAGKGLYVHAGPEIGVASTKAFTSQVAAINVLSMMLNTDSIYRMKMSDEMRAIPQKLSSMIKTNDDLLKEIASDFSKYNDFLYLGRGINYPVAMEGALKLKEISYIHAEGYGAGEMKHGPIALIDENTPSLFILTGDAPYVEKTISNMKEIKARNGRIIALSDGTYPIDDTLDSSDYIIPVPNTLEQLSPVINVVALQLLAYHMANKRGCEIDQPRNLAKSVTVE